MGWLISLYGMALIAAGKLWLLGGLCLLAGAAELVPAYADFGIAGNLAVYAGAGFLLIRTGLLLRQWPASNRISGAETRAMHQPSNEDRAPERPVR